MRIWKWLVQDCPWFRAVHVGVILISKCWCISSWKKKKLGKKRQRNKQWFRRSKSLLEAGGVLHGGSWRLESSWLPSCVCDSWFQLPNAGEWMQHLKHVSLLLFCYLKTLSVISLSNMRFVGSKMSIFHGSQRWLSPQAVPAGLSLGWMMLQSWQTFLQRFCIERGQNRKGLCSLLHWQHAEGWNSPRTDLLFLWLRMGFSAWAQTKHLHQHLCLVQLKPGSWCLLLPRKLCLGILFWGIYWERPLNSLQGLCYWKSLEHFTLEFYGAYHRAELSGWDIWERWTSDINEIIIDLRCLF